MNASPLRSLHSSFRSQSPKHISQCLHSPHPHRLILRHFNNPSVHSSVHVNVSQKDCLRLAFIYGACGTFASYLSMNYDGKVLVFKWSVPSPERFIFHTWCWSIAGTTSWVLFWTKPDALIRVAGSRMKYGLLHGVQTTGLALMLSFSTIGFFSLYFDVKEWQSEYGEWQRSRSMAHSANSTLMADLSAKRTSTISPNNALIEEEGNEQGELEANIVNMDELGSGVQMINQQMEKEQKQTQSAKGGGKGTERREKPVLTYQMVADHMYEPTKLFFMCNAPIWMFCGSVTGMIAARILTNGIVLNPINVAAGFGSLCLMDRAADGHSMEMMESDEDGSDR